MCNYITETVRYYIVDSATGQQIDTDCNGIPLNKCNQFNDNQIALKHEFMALFFSEINCIYIKCSYKIFKWISENHSMIKTIVNMVNHDGETPLTLALLHNNTDIVKILIDAGANVNIADKRGYTPLKVASYHGRTECVKCLIDAGADVNLANKNGQTPLYWASLKGCTECVKLLIDAGADVNIPDKKGQTPLYWASRYGRTDCVKCLIDAGANVNIADEEGDTPLYWASRYGRTDCVKCLIDAGADVNIVNIADKDGKTPLYWASYYGYTECVKYLIDTGAKDDHYIINKSNVLSGFYTETLTNGEMVYTHSMYKKVCETDKNNVTKTYIITLKLPVNAECNIGYYNKTDYITNVKYRASYMYVDRIECDNTQIESVYNNNQKGVKYTVGEMVYPDEYNTNPYEVCTSGIHFFMDKTSAKYYIV